MSSSDSTPPYRTTVVRSDEVTPVEVDPLETAKWTQYVPEWGGMRAAIRANNYRWCFKESLMWGIATGTAMSFHRLRMGSRTRWAVNVGFASLCVVGGGSYYFCCKRRDYKERMIEVMMKLNTFEHASQMPAETPLQEHPFQKPGQGDGSDLPGQEFRGHIKEKKEWQPRDETKDMHEVFKEKRTRGGDR